MTKDLLLSLCASVLSLIAAFLIIVNALDWLWFRDFPEDATRGITENLYGAALGLAAGIVAGITVFAWRRSRRTA